MSNAHIICYSKEVKEHLFLSYDHNCHGRDRLNCLMKNIGWFFNFFLVVNIVLIKAGMGSLGTWVG